jgi:hypothetical protein
MGTYRVWETQVLEGRKASAPTTILSLRRITCRSHVTARLIGDDIGCIDGLRAVTQVALLQGVEAVRSARLSVTESVTRCLGKSRVVNRRTVEDGSAIEAGGGKTAKEASCRIGGADEKARVCDGCDCGQRSALSSGLT